MEEFVTSEATKVSVSRCLEVLTGPERRRRHTDEEKAALVAESLRPRVCVASLAWRHGLHPQQLYTWRGRARRGARALRDDMPMFAAVVAAEPSPVEPGPRPGDFHLLALEFGETRLRIGTDVPPERAAALVAALRAR